MADVISENYNYVVTKGEFMKLIKLNAQSRQVKLGRTSVDVKGLIGQPVGSLFRLVPRKGGSTVCDAHLVHAIEDLSDQLTSEQSVDDNRHLVGGADSQTLSRSDIDQMKEQGVSGRQIVSSIVENSTTFDAKTEYSQEKYVRKKQKKYFEFVCVQRPSIRILARMLYMQDPLKILNLRVDSLSQLLSACNVRAGVRCLLLENGCQGLCVASVLQRVAPTGIVLQTYSGSRPHRQAVNGMNFSSDQLNCLLSVSIERIVQLLKPDSSTASAPADPASEHVADGSLTGGATTHCVTDEVMSPVVSNGRSNHLSNGSDLSHDVSASHLEKSVKDSTETSATDCTETSATVTDCTETSASADCTEPSANADCTETSANADCTETSANSDCTETSADAYSTEKSSANCENSSSAGKRGAEVAISQPTAKRLKLETEDEARALSILCEANMDALIVCTRQHPLSIVLFLLRFLHVSRPFAIFSPYKEPLTECYFALKARGCVLLKLSETWMRQYQVLPERTHPMVNMSGGGGYLLTGYKIHRSSQIVDSKSTQKS